MKAYFTAKLNERRFSLPINAMAGVGQFSDCADDLVMANVSDMKS